MSHRLTCLQRATRCVFAACICAASLPAYADDLRTQKYSYRLSVSGAFVYDTQAGQDADTEKYLSVLTDQRSSQLLRQKFGTKFTGLVVVANPIWVLSRMGIPKGCQHFSRSGDQITITLTSFSHPLPFDPDVDWLTAIAVEVRSNERTNATQVPCERGQQQASPASSHHHVKR